MPGAHWTRMVKVLVGSLALVFVFSASSSLAQSSDVPGLEAKLHAVQRQLQEIQTALNSAETPESGRGTLAEQVEQLSTQLKILSRQIELDKEQAAERARTTPQTAAGKGGFSVQSADGQFRLRLRGYVHSDGRFFVDDTDRRGIDTFVLRRVRPVVEATMYGIFDVRIMPDFGSGATVLRASR